MALVQTCQIFNFFTLDIVGGQYHQYAETDRCHQRVSNGVIQTRRKADRPRHKRQQDEAHMRYGGIGKHTFDIGLHDGGKVTDQKRCHRQHGEHLRPVVMHRSQTGNQDAKGKDDGGDFRRRTDKGGNGCRRAVVHVGHPHMKRHRAQFERYRHDDKHQPQFQQPFVGKLAVRRRQNGGEFERTRRAVDHRNAVEQQPGSQRAQDEIFERGFGGASGIAAQRNHGVKRQRQKFQTDIGGQEMRRAHHHAHA